MHFSDLFRWHVLYICSNKTVISQDVQKPATPADLALCLQSCLALAPCYKWWLNVWKGTVAQRKWTGPIRLNLSALCDASHTSILRTHILKHRPWILHGSLYASLSFLNVTCLTYCKGFVSFVRYLLVFGKITLSSPLVPPALCFPSGKAVSAAALPRG